MTARFNSGTPAWATASSPAAASGIRRHAAAINIRNGWAFMSDSTVFAGSGLVDWDIDRWLGRLGGDHFLHQRQRLTEWARHFPRAKTNKAFAAAEAGRAGIVIDFASAEAGRTIAGVIADHAEFQNTPGVANGAGNSFVGRI